MHWHKWDTHITYLMPKLKHLGGRRDIEMDRARSSEVYSETALARNVTAIACMNSLWLISTWTCAENKTIHKACMHMKTLLCYTLSGATIGNR